MPRLLGSGIHGVVWFVTLPKTTTIAWRWEGAICREAEGYSYIYTWVCVSRITSKENDEYANKRKE